MYKLKTCNRRPLTAYVSVYAHAQSHIFCLKLDCTHTRTLSLSCFYFSLLFSCSLCMYIKSASSTIHAWLSNTRIRLHIL
jgi:hypothetical protein